MGRSQRFQSDWHCNAFIHQIPFYFVDPIAGQFNVSVEFTNRIGMAFEPDFASSDWPASTVTNRSSSGNDSAFRSYFEAFKIDILQRNFSPRFYRHQVEITNDIHPVRRQRITLTKIPFC